MHFNQMHLVLTLYADLTHPLSQGLILTRISASGLIGDVHALFADGLPPCGRLSISFYHALLS